MSFSDENELQSTGNLKAQIRTIKIIAFALMQGIIIFAVIAVFMGKDIQGQPDEPILAYIAAGFSAIALVMSMVVPPIIQKTMNKKLGRHPLGDTSMHDMYLFGIFQTKFIIGNAILEGASFFVLVAFIITGQWWLLAIVGFLLAVMAATFPTRGRVENYIETQKQLMQFEE